MITAALFDFDGVVADTEPLYDLFWENIAREHRIHIPHFSAKIKGTTLSSIFTTYFSQYSPEERNKIVAAIHAYESEMTFPEVPGAVNFLHTLKLKGYQTGLVTSSSSEKMRVALKQMGIGDFFDTIVTADRITQGKPNPICYLLAAEDLKVKPAECIVFEDSFSGIQAGNGAGMRVIGLATTNPVAAIQEQVYAVIPDFQDENRILRFF